MAALCMLNLRYLLEYYSNNNNNNFELYKIVVNYLDSNASPQIFHKRSLLLLQLL